MSDWAQDNEFETWEELSPEELIQQVLGEVTDWPASEWKEESAIIVAELFDAGYRIVKLDDVWKSQFFL